MSQFKPYPAYKDSGVEWLGEVPEHWMLTPIKYLALLNPRKSDYDGDTEQLCSFVPMEKLKTGVVQLDEERPIGEVIGGYTYFEDGDVLQAKVTPCFENKNVAIAKGLTNGIGFGSSEINVLRPYQGVNAEYLYYRVQEDSYMSFCTSSMIGAGGLKRVPTDVINNFKIAAPTLCEQTQIARFLDHETARIDALIEEQQRLIELLKEKRQAVISHAVTKGLDPTVPMKDSGVEWLGEVPVHWKVSKLGHYAQILTGFPFPSASFSHDESDVRLLRGANIGVGSLKWIDTVYWELNEGDELSSYLMTEGQIVLGMDRPWISEGMRIARVTQDDMPCLLLQRVAAITPSAGLNDEYLYCLLASALFKAYVEPDLTGVSVPHISPEQILSFQIPVPHIDEQRKIGRCIKDQLDQMSALFQQASESVELLQERRSALISAAVTGKIDVRSWQPPASTQAPKLAVAEAN